LLFNSKEIELILKMKLSKYLFPKKRGDKDKLIAEVKLRIRELSGKEKSQNKKADVNLQNAMIALKRNEKDRAKNYMVQSKRNQMNADKTRNKITNYDRYIEAIEEGSSMKFDKELLSEIQKMLTSITSSITPEDIAATTEDIDVLINQLDDAASILAGDPEIDLAIDVTDELNALETRMLLESTGEMPTTPTQENYITEQDLEEKDINLMSRDEILKQIDKYRKELDG